MDPVTAFALGATALQVAVWGCNAIIVCRDLTSKGATQKNLDAYDEALDVSNITDILSSHLKNVNTTGHVSLLDKKLLDIAKECNKSGKELRAQLEKLKPHKSDTRLKILAKALQTLLKEKRISELEGTFRRHRAALETTMLTRILYVPMESSKPQFDRFADYLQRQDRSTK